MRIPSPVEVHEVTGPSDSEREFVITNSASGQHFSADISTVRLLEALRRGLCLEDAAAQAGILEPHARDLANRFQEFGIAVEGHTVPVARPANSAVEARLISFRLDMLDAAPIARRFHWLGAAFFSLPGLMAVVVAAAAALLALAENLDKAAASLRLVTGYGVTEIAAFLTLFVGLKLFHELGHILAYRVFCIRAGLDPGPIRTGIMVFAATPFPFTDVTGAWRLRSRFKRAAIGAGGIYFEIALVSVLTLIWAYTSTNIFQTLVLQVAVFSGALTLLFNLNPAVKLDGYYIMTDLLRLPNLAGRASLAARNWAARRLGADLPAPEAGALAYWAIAYAYRWTIFAGVFWISYQFDPRLAPVALVVAILSLVVRPLVATLKLARAHGARPLRSAIAGGVVGITIAAALVPLPARLLVPGQLLTFRTEFIRPAEASRLVPASGVAAVAFEQPDLTYMRDNLKLRITLLQGLSRAIPVSGAEQAILREDLTSVAQMKVDVDSRLAALVLELPDAARWTPLAARTMTGAWIRPDTEQAIGAISHPVEPFLSLRLPQGRLDSELDALTSDGLDVRFTADPACTFRATLTRSIGESLAAAGEVRLEAEPDGGLPPCAQKMRSGAAIIARLPMPRKSLFDHARTGVARALQNRLPLRGEGSG